MLQNISSKYNKKILHDLYNEHDNNKEVLFYHYHVFQLKKRLTFVALHQNMIFMITFI